MQHTAQQGVISTESRPDCYLCGKHGEVLYRDLEDRLFGAPGSWTLKRCPGSDCGLIWLDAMPTEKDIGKAYLDYYTHEDGNIQTRKKRGTFKRLTRPFCLARDNGYLALKYNAANGASGFGKLTGLLITSTLPAKLHLISAPCIYRYDVGPSYWRSAAAADANWSFCGSSAGRRKVSIWIRQR